jgi:hypothetical protein
MSENLSQPSFGSLVKASRATFPEGHTAYLHKCGGISLMNPLDNRLVMGVFGQSQIPDGCSLAGEAMKKPRELHGALRAYRKDA